MSDKITITKRAAARSEIDGAIRLLVEHRNFIASELLASATIDVIAGVASAASAVTMTSTFYDVWIKPEFGKEARRHMKRSYNFIKHADRDHEEIIEDFDRVVVIWRIFIAISDYESVWRSKSLPMALYLVWFLSLHPHLLNEEHAAMTDGFVRKNGRIEGLSLTDALVVLTAEFKEFDELQDALHEQLAAMFPNSIEA